MNCTTATCDITSTKITFAKQMLQHCQNVVNDLQTIAYLDKYVPGHLRSESVDKVIENINARIDTNLQSVQDISASINAIS